MQLANMHYAYYRNNFIDYFAYNLLMFISFIFPYYP